LENGDSGSTEPKLKRSQSASVRNSRIPHIGKKRLRGDREVMQDPLKVTYQNLSASIKYYPSDGFCGGVGAESKWIIKMAANGFVKQRVKPTKRNPTSGKNLYWVGWQLSASSQASCFMRSRPTTEQW